MDPHVSIIILNWNGWQDTIACIDSVKTLTYRRFSITVVDNHSTDDSIDRIRNAHPDILPIDSGANLGFAGGNNIGIRKALEDGAEYMWLLNNDTLVEPHSLSEMVEVAQSDASIGAVGSVLYYMDQPNIVQAWGGGRLYMWGGVARHIRTPKSTSKINYISAASILLRRQALEEVGLLDERFFMYWEDADLSFRLRKAGWKLAVASNSYVLHKENATLGRRSAAQNTYNQRSSIIFYRKHSPIPIIPITVGLLARITKRILQRDWQRAKDLILSFRQASTSY